MTRIDWRATALERTQGVRHHLMRHALLLGALVAVLWSIELFDALVLRGALDGWGIQPRTLGGLQAIVVAPWLHAGFGHLLANTIPLVVLGWFVMLRRTSDFFVVALATLLASGLGIWLFGGAATIHLGVSGVVFGLFGYLLARGYYERSAIAISLALVAFLIYGGMVWGMLPLQPGVSWQGHLFGFVGGVVVAYLQARSVSMARG
ncbi:MAG TPA: rhomboid family intramembrane serine protease [Chloroflexi bacterium]|nr:rhomboid family intramembrane serine protease [Chloroflexota bacterium]